MSDKLALPAFLKIFTANDVSASTAMNVAGKIYKTYNTKEKLATLTDFDLESAGVDSKEDRKLVMSALRKAGFKASVSGRSASKAKTPSASTSKADSTSPKKKRKRDDVANELLPDGPTDEGTAYGSLDFQKVLDEEVLRTKSTVVNRAPLMTAWAMVVAERLGFQREEALSIASVYTEMNAVTKGVSLGIFKADREKGIEARRDGSQPYVDLMGRRIPLYKSEDTSGPSWRALNAGTPVPPSTAYSYVKRSLRQTAPFMLGALRILAASYDPKALNERGFALYADFRPEQVGWGEKAPVTCATILSLRRKGGEATSNKALQSDGDADTKGDGPVAKKARVLTVEEYEAQLDNDPSWAEAIQGL